MAGKSGREISATPKKSVKDVIFSREGALVILLIAVNIFGIIISKVYNPQNVLREMPKYLAEIFIMLGMAYILVLGDIDISVGSIVCLCATMACLFSNAGIPMVGVIILVLLVGFVCGSINGLVATKFPELPTMIITLATQIIFRGIAEVSLGSGGSTSLSNNTKEFTTLAMKVGNLVPLSLFFVVIAAIIFGVLLGKMTFGRKLYAIGSNKTAAKFAGIEVEKYRFICFALIGFMAGICGLFLVSTLFGANTTTGQGFEMEVIAMCVFGGIATTGGKGNLIGGFIAAFVIICLRIALGQVNVNTQIILVVIGIMLIVAVLIPTISNYISDAKKKASRA
ncbi:MAG: ABC transporter permease [Lachnospiraceae bacterium]|nr:ABC transporter permease [Lachnospiraceae bacterium]